MFAITQQKLPNKNDATELCKKLYEILSPEGYYPALTGGLLYKGDERKDIDIVIFRNRQSVVNFEMENIQNLLEDVGFHSFQFYGFVTKCIYEGFSVDLFNPETQVEFEDGDYTG